MKLKERRIIQGLVLFSIVIVVIISLFGDKGFLQLMELKKKEKILVRDIENLKEERKDWIRKINSLKTNKTYKETLAREQLGMVHNTEMFIQIHYGEGFTSSASTQSSE